MTKVVKYGLRNKGDKEVLSYYSTSNAGSDFCVENSFMLSFGGAKMWLVDSPHQAEYVRQHSTPWYNAGYETPENPFDDLEVVKITVGTEVEAENVSIPTLKE